MSAAHAPAVSTVVVTYDQPRELARTLATLLPPYQRWSGPSAPEVILVDNGSPQPADRALPGAVLEQVRRHRIDDAAPSPAAAANLGIGLAQAALIGVIVDGARMATPGLLERAAQAAALVPRAVVTAPAWHLGPDVQARSGEAGYDQAAEDTLLASIPWEHDGYELFTIATPAPSSGRGLFGAMGESSSLFLHRSLWDELGGFDERFALPGGGLVNHDLYRRACALPETEVVVLLGEGTFHQLHGGAATSGRVTRNAMRADYEAIRGYPHRPPTVDPLYLGRVPPQYRPYMQASIELAAGRPTSQASR